MSSKRKYVSKLMRYLTFLEIFSPTAHVLKELLFVFIHGHVSDAITESYEKRNFC